MPKKSNYEAGKIFDDDPFKASAEAPGSNYNFPTVHGPTTNSLPREQINLYGDESNDINTVPDSWREFKEQRKQGHEDSRPFKHSTNRYMSVQSNVVKHIHLYLLVFNMLYKCIIL